jgi:hypothetical protein
MAEWGELARDIRDAHALLVYLFGNGVIFDGNAWEEQKYYHARTIYLKWIGSQALRGLTEAEDSLIVDNSGGLQIVSVVLSLAGTGV